MLSHRLRMSIPLLVLLALALLGRPLQAQEREPDPRSDRAEQPNLQNFIEQHDKNNDGSLDRDELPAPLRARFERADANNDGKLSAEELRRYAARMQRPMPIEAVTIWVVEAERDPLSREDLQQAYDTLRKLDKDNDGTISAEEIRAGRQRVLEQRIDALLKRQDNDNDGKITREEAQGGLRQAFNRLDSNNDGSVDRNELEQAAIAPQPDAASEERPERPGRERPERPDRERREQPERERPERP